MIKEDAVERLCSVYRENQKIGLVLSAGVSQDSGVPSWKDLPFNMLELAKRGMFKGASCRVLDFLNARSRSMDKDPDTILQLISGVIDSERNLRLLVKRALYENVKRKCFSETKDKKSSKANNSSKTDDLSKMYTPRMRNVLPCIYRGNKTLDAVISFCSAVPGLVVAEGPWVRWKTNRKVGGILTTNYDNLVEASFNSKYGIGGLRPVAREQKHTKKGKPVCHIHGYVSFVDDPKDPDGVKASKLVLAEQDYYRVFYNWNDFSNAKAMEVLGQFPCLFVGCSMKDRNIRRILFRLKSEGNSEANRREHFAILPLLEDTGEQEFEDAVLMSFGVTAIRLKKPEDLGSQVAAILRDVYLSLEGVEEEHWNKAREGWCKRGMVKAQ